MCHITTMKIVHILGLNVQIYDDRPNDNQEWF